MSRRLAGWCAACHQVLRNAARTTFSMHPVVPPTQSLTVRVPASSRPTHTEHLRLKHGRLPPSPSRPCPRRASGQHEQRACIARLPPTYLSKSLLRPPPPSPSGSTWGIWCCPASCSGPWGRGHPCGRVASGGGAATLLAAAPRQTPSTLVLQLLPPPGAVAIADRAPAPFPALTSGAACAGRSSPRR